MRASMKSLGLSGEAAGGGSGGDLRIALHTKESPSGLAFSSSFLHYLLGLGVKPCNNALLFFISCVYSQLALAVHFLLTGRPQPPPRPSAA